MGPGQSFSKFSPKYFAQLVENSNSSAMPMPTAEILRVLTPVVFDPTVLAKRTNKDQREDVVVTSAANFYQGITAAEVDKYYQDMIQAAGENAPMIGLNSKLTKEGGVIKEIFWPGCDEPIFIHLDLPILGS